MKTIAVKFKEKFKKEFNSKPYFYRTNLKVSEGDLVVVDTTFGPEIAYVCNDEELKDHIINIADLKYVICKVTFTEHNKLLKKLEQLQEVSERISKLQKQIDRKRARDNFVKEYPEASSLVDEHEKLYDELGLNGEEEL